MEAPDESEAQPPPRVWPQLLAPMLEESVPRSVQDGAAATHPSLADLLQSTETTALDSPLERLRMRAEPRRATRAPRSDLCKRLCELADLQPRHGAAAVMLQRAARRPVVHLCDDVVYAGGLLPVAAMKKVHPPASEPALT